ncbi:hypothetical protein NEAUS06_2226 [Nematocida ausubeli]|nr:hypothetical protein NEAUS06_2226 [Nematocida ausubeli]
MKKIIRMEKIVPEARKKISEEMEAQSFFDIINPSRLSAGSIDEGVFPDEILEGIERKREQLLQKMEVFVAKAAAQKIQLCEKKDAVQEIQTTIRVILLEIEKLQVQTGTNCVKECSRMLSELECINKKMQTTSTLHRRLYFLTLAVVIFGLVAVAKEKFMN